MAQVFISYNSYDFASEIGEELMGESDVEERGRQLGKAQILILILSKGAMQSNRETMLLWHRMVIQSFLIH